MAKKILLVEDDKFLMRMYIDKFTGVGFEVIVAYNGKEGLEKALSEKPDLIMADVRMPEMDGMTMVEQIKSDQANQSLPVILLSNLSSNEDMIKANNLPNTEYLIKGNHSLEELLDIAEKKLT